MPMVHRAHLWGSWLLLVMMVSLVSLNYVRVRGQSTVDLERRMTSMEEVKADKRISIVETRLDNIEFLGKTILTGVFGQLMLQVLNFRRRQGTGSGRIVTAEK